jgi:hypothetical protein
MMEGTRVVLKHAPGVTYKDWMHSLFDDHAIPPPFPGHDHGPWELIGAVPAKFNRLVVYPTWQFHSVVMNKPKPSISIDNVRLTLNTFMKHPALERIARVPVASVEGLVPTLLKARGRGGRGGRG